MLHSKRYPGLYIKEEGANPTGTFKARGLGLAVTMAKHYGLQHLAVPSAGNAAGALAAYAAAAGIAAHIFMPQDVPFANYLEGIVYGADVTMVDGLISDCARIVGERIKAQKEANTPANEVWFDISTLKEPFRVEGKKTMGYELVEQLGWTYPDAVFYPTGGGVGLIGMWKAFEEMEQLGWVTGSKRPKMYALQASGCEPIVKAFEEHKPASEFFQNADTFAAGLRVPKPYGDYHHPRHPRAIRRQSHRPPTTQPSSPASSTGPNTKASSSPPKAPPPPPPTTSSSPQANSSPPTRSSSSTPAPASSTPT